MDINSAVSSIFGSGSAETIFAAGVTGGATPAQQAAKTTIDSAQREINRIRGYKLQLTPAEENQLSKIQEDIRAIDRKAADGTVRQDELDDRAELYREADTIIGKPSAEVDSDTILEGYRQAIDDLLAPRLDRPAANRLETLENLKANIEEQIGDNPNSRTAQLQLQNVARQINDIVVPRNISELSQSERVEYDRLVEQVNEYAGAKLVLDARESVRVFNLEKTIQDMQGSLPPDPASQPTASSVARAYARFG